MSTPAGWPRLQFGGALGALNVKPLHTLNMLCIPKKIMDGMQLQSLQNRFDDQSARANPGPGRERGERTPPHRGYRGRFSEGMTKRHSR